MKTFHFMGRSGSFPLAYLVVLFLAGQVSTVRATVTIGGNGDVSPALPWNATNANPGTVGVSVASGTATLTVENDLLTSGSCYIAETGTTGLVTIDGASSTWTNTYNLIIGDNGNGTLNITNGAVVNVSTSGNTIIAHNPSTTGVVTVDGSNSELNDGANIYVGSSSTSNNASATLNITNGGLVYTNASTLVNYINSPGSTAMINFGATNGGTLTLLKTLYVGASQLSGVGTLMPAVW